MDEEHEHMTLHDLSQLHRTASLCARQCHLIAAPQIIHAHPRPEQDRCAVGCGARGCDLASLIVVGSFEIE
jgi:hypothetical protein